MCHKTMTQILITHLSIHGDLRVKLVLKCALSKDSKVKLFFFFFLQLRDTPAHSEVPPKYHYESPRLVSFT